MDPNLVDISLLRILNNYLGGAIQPFLRPQLGFAPGLSHTPFGAPTLGVSPFANTIGINTVGIVPTTTPYALGYNPIVPNVPGIVDPLLVSGGLSHTTFAPSLFLAPQTLGTLAATRALEFQRRFGGLV